MLLVIYNGTQRSVENPMTNKNIKEIIRTARKVRKKFKFENSYYNALMGLPRHRMYYDLPKGEHNLLTEKDFEVYNILRVLGFKEIDINKNLGYLGSEKNPRRLVKFLSGIGLDEYSSYIKERNNSLLPDRNCKLVVSANIEDIIMCSTGRRWTSCLDLVNGNEHHQISELVNGILDANSTSLIAYVIDEDDLEIKDPLGRLFINGYNIDRDITSLIVYDVHHTYNNKLKSLNSLIKRVNTYGRFPPRAILEISSIIKNEINSDLNVDLDRNNSTLVGFYTDYNSYSFKAIYETILNKKKQFDKSSNTGNTLYEAIIKGIPVNTEKSKKLGICYNDIVNSKKPKTTSVISLKGLPLDYKIGVVANYGEKCKKTDLLTWGPEVNKILKLKEQIAK